MLYLYTIFYMLSWAVGAVALVLLIVRLARSASFKDLFTHRHLVVPFAVIILAVLAGVYSYKTYPPDFAMPPFMMTMAPGGGPAPYLPLKNVLKYFATQSQFERVADIGADPNAVPPPITRNEPATVEIHLTAKEVIAEVAPNVYFNYWTYNGQTPAPMLRVREGDTVILSLTNDKTSLHVHNIDLHSVNGPGGGATLTNVEPGETKIFKWKALNPGLYEYHCAAMNVSTHNAHGQYGLILVEPKEGLSPVDKEFYVMQGELYTAGDLGRQGMTVFDAQKLLDGNPTYVTFNGRVESKNKMEVNRGDRVRIYVGNGGINLISSFHIIGEIFDTVYPEGAMGKGSSVFKNVQTTIVPAGGSAVVEFTVEVPGRLLLVDHALARLNKGAWATMIVKGEESPDVYSQIGDVGSMEGMDMGGY